jgi:hypothetical protein
MANQKGGDFMLSVVIGFRVALFESISTRNVSGGWIYFACDVFPHASLAHAF